MKKTERENLLTKINNLSMENDTLKNDIILLEEKVELVKKDRDKYRKIAGYPIR